MKRQKAVLSGKIADIAQNLLPDLFIAHNAVFIERLSACFKLRLDQQNRLCGIGQERRKQRNDLFQRDKGYIAGCKFSRESVRLRRQIAQVGALADNHARIAAEHICKLIVSDIDCEHDAICGKIPDAAFVCENVVVRNCRLASNCNFIKLGTASYGTFRNWRVHECVLERCRAAPLDGLQWFRRGVWGVTDELSGISGICLEAVDGGRIEDVEIRDIEMRSGVQTPVFLRVGARHGADLEGSFRDVSIERVKGFSCSWIASSITGVPKRRIGGGIVLRDIDLVLKGGISGVDWNAPVPEREKSYRCFGTPLPAYGFYLRHADGVRFENVRLSCSGGLDGRPPVVSDDCTGVDFSGCSF